MPTAMLSSLASIILLAMTTVDLQCAWDAGYAWVGAEWDLLRASKSGPPIGGDAEAAAVAVALCLMLSPLNPKSPPHDPGPVTGGHARRTFRLLQVLGTTRPALPRTSRPTWWCTSAALLYGSSLQKWYGHPQPDCTAGHCLPGLCILARATCLQQCRITVLPSMLPAGTRSTPPGGT